MSVSRWRIYDNAVFEMIPNYGERWMELATAILDGTDRPKREIEGFADYIRKNKKRYLDQYEGVREHAEVLDIDLTTVKDGWLKHKAGSFRFINKDFIEPEQETARENFRNTLIEELKNYSPKFPKLERVENSNGYCLVVDPADIHIGKLASAFETGEAYNNQIAVKRVLDGVRGILNKVQSFHIDRIMFVGGNDILHIDNPQRKTTSGTPQDTDGDWHTNFLIAKQLYVDVLEILLSVADVHFVFNPSNHDYTNGFFLAQVIETHFRNCQNITFDCSIAHRKYFRYHNNLIGSSHGDGAKAQDLPLLMAHESKDWTDCKHKYIYTHHVHHKTSKDYMGVCVESLRSPSGTDSWHHRNGYEHSPKAVEAFLHDKVHGQIARITHLF